MKNEPVSWRELLNWLTPSRFWLLLTTFVSLLSAAFGFGVWIQHNHSSTALAQKDILVLSAKKALETETARHNQLEEINRTAIQRLRAQLNSRSGGASLDIAGQNFFLSADTIIIPQRDARSLLGSSSYFVRGGNMLVPDFTDSGWRDFGTFYLAQLWSSQYEDELPLFDEDEVPTEQSPLWLAKCWLFQSPPDSEFGSNRTVCIAGTVHTGATSNIIRHIALHVLRRPQTGTKKVPETNGTPLGKPQLNTPTTSSVSAFRDFRLPYTEAKMGQYSISAVHFARDFFLISAESHRVGSDSTSSITLMSVTKDDTVYFFLAAGTAASHLSSSMLEAKRWIQSVRVSQ